MVDKYLLSSLHKRDFSNFYMGRNGFVKKKRKKVNTLAIIITNSSIQKEKKWQ